MSVEDASEEDETHIVMASDSFRGHEVQIVFASYHVRMLCVPKEDAQPTMKSRRPRTNHIEVYN